MDKKLGQESEYYEQEGIEPEFTRMSRGSKKLKTGGIGAGWYERYKGDLYPHGYAVIRGGIKSNIPRFYAEKYEKEEPLKYQEVKERRKIAMAEQWRNNTPDRLRVRERIKKAAISSLKRNLE